MAIRTVTFQSVMHRALRKVGLDPANVPAATLIAVGEYIDEHVRAGWDSTAFPELTPIEERAFREVYYETRQYFEGDEVYHVGIYYRALGTTLGNAPTNADYWEVITPKRWIAKAQFGRAVMDNIIRFTHCDPREGYDGGEILFTDHGDYVWLECYRATVWVRYQLPAAQFAYNPVVGGTTYAAGDVVFNPADGECYLALVSALGSQLGDAEKWERQPLPVVLKDYAALRTAASLQSEDGQDLKAAKLEAQAQGALEDERNKFIFVPAGGEQR